MVAKNDISDLIRFGVTTLFIALFFGGIVFALVWVLGKEASKVNVADLSKAVGLTTAAPAAPAAKEPLTMHFVGDVMLDRGVEYMINKYGGGDYRFPFLNVADKLKAADVVFGNLEGPVSDKGYKAGSIYSFEADPKAIDGLKYAGFNVMSCANNHMFDYTRLALEDTLSRLQEAGILCVGAGLNQADVSAPEFLDIKGNKIAFLAYADFDIPSWQATDSRSGFAKLTTESLKTGIETAKKQGADIVIVSFHFGAEYQAAENETQRKWAYSAIDDGANLVIGHHPHVVEPVEEYQPSVPSDGAIGKSMKRENLFNYGFIPKKEEAGASAPGWIAYSFGNFVFDQSFSKDTMEGGFLEVFTDNGKIKSVSTKKVQINNRYQPNFSNE
jgi:poly-gamma-glutamate synthesis protein (capsule biosynthesis protein)